MGQRQQRHRRALDTDRQADLTDATIRYYETGDGPPVVFVHGFITHADLWRNVIPGVAAAGYRCIAPDWPHGAHTVPAPAADLSLPGIADLIAEFLDALDLVDVTIVANDTGGAATQILLTRRPDRVARVVLTPSDCYEYCPPPVLGPLKLVARSRIATHLTLALLRIRALQRLPITFGWATKRRLEPDVIDAYLQPSRSSAAIRNDLRRYVAGADRKHTLAAARHFGSIETPTLIVWSRDDRLLPFRLAERLADELPNATLQIVDDAYTFLPEDQPTLLADLIVRFADTPATQQALR